MSAKQKAFTYRKKQVVARLMLLVKVLLNFLKNMSKLIFHNMKVSERFLDMKH